MNRPLRRPVETPRSILVTAPDLSDPGGVASFVRSIRPFIEEWDILEVGSTKGKRSRFYHITDQYRFRNLAAKGYSLVHVNPSLNMKSFIRDGIFVWQAKQIGLPVLAFFHGWRASFERTITRRLLRFFHWTFGRADAFVVLASEFRRALHRWGVSKPIYLGTTTIDHSLVDDFSFEDKVRDLRESGPLKVLFLSRLEKDKGVFETVDAVCRLLEKRVPIQLSVAGNGPAMHDLRNYILSKNLSAESVQLLGYVRGEEKRRAFITNHLYCFPTYYGEGLPTSILESMAFGMPVVTCPVGGIADMFQDGKMGRLCKSHDPAGLAGLLVELAVDRETCVEMGRYNHAHAKRHFMASVVARQLRDIYARHAARPFR